MRILHLLPPIQDPKVRDEWKGLIANSQPVLDLVISKLKDNRDIAHRSFKNISRHCDPGYPYTLTDYIGYIRGLEEVINLLEEKENE